MIDYPNYIEGQMSLLDLGMQCTKTSLVPSVPTKEKTSELCWKKWQGSSKKESLFLDLRKGSGAMQESSSVTDGQLLGESSMLNIGESLNEGSGFALSQILMAIQQPKSYLTRINNTDAPTEEIPSHLSEILEQNPDPKYNLSAKACQGILNRAERRGKKLPPMLQEALEQVILFSHIKTEKDVQGGGKGFLLQEDRSASLRTNNFQTVFQPVETVALEGNGQRPSHMGDGYSVSDKSYTLNSTEVHGVAYAVDIGGGKSACDIIEDKSPTLCTTHYGEPTVVYDARGNGDGNIVPTMTGDHQNRITDYTGVVVSMDRETYQDKCGSLCARDYKGVGSQYVSEDKLIVARVPGAVCYTSSHGGFMTNFTEGTAHTLEASDYKDAPMIAYYNCVVAVDCRSCTENDVNGTLQASSCHNLNSNNVVRVRYIVRRLTPLECERLQGYPDGWTDIGDYIDSKGKKRKVADSNRYKALGNSIALPSWRWVLKRMCANYERPATMASLFDGISGFAHIWQQINGPGSCLWASEIEDFPMAVSKERIQ